jgi:hypothetical protein
VDGISTVTLIAGTGMTISDNTPSAGSITLSSSGGSGYAGKLWIFADPNFATGTSYERIATDGVQLAPQRTWMTTIADAKTNPPSGWAWSSTTNLGSADANTTTADALHVVGGTGSSYTYGSGPELSRVYQPPAGPTQRWIARMALQNGSAANVAAGLMVGASGAASSSRLVIYDQGGASTYTLYGETPGGSTSTATMTLTQMNQGVWLMIRRGVDGVITLWYNLANQTTPPSTWTLYRTSGAQSTTVSDPVGLTFYRGGSVAPVVDWLYYDDSGALEDAVPNTTQNGQTGTGFLATSPVLTLVSGFDLGGSGATVTDANAQAALAEITNPREWDTAAWTWSVSRGSSAPVSCGGGTYAAAASVTVGGTGRYVSVCGKAASDGTQPASVNATALRIPFTP